MNLESAIPTTQRPQNTRGVVNDHLTADVRDKPRGKDLVRVKVVNRCTAALQVESSVIGPGTHELLVYEDRVKTVMAQVEDDHAAIEAARKAYLNRIAADVIKVGNFTGTTEEFLQAAAAGALTDELKRDLKGVLDDTNLSVESIFQEAAGRSIRPLDSCEVMGGDRVPEPKRAEMDKDKRVLVDAMGEAMARAFREAGVGNPKQKS